MMEYLAFLHRNTCSPNHCPFVFAELVDTCKTFESTLPDFSCGISLKWWFTVWPSHKPKVCRCRHCNGKEESQTKRARWKKKCQNITKFVIHYTLELTCGWGRQCHQRRRTSNTSIQQNCEQHCLDNWRDLRLQKPSGPQQWSRQTRWHSYPTPGYPQSHQYAWKPWNI